jgi:hypothetical protein
MAQCSNCKSKLGCGCQRKTATDGRSVCVNCAAKYEYDLSLKNRNKLVQPNPTKSDAPVIQKVSVRLSDV